MLSKFENDGKLNPSFKTGPFKLPVGKIWGYPKEPQAPRFVLVSSAGVTRPDRWLSPMLQRSTHMLHVQSCAQLQLTSTAHEIISICMLLRVACTGTMRTNMTWLTQLPAALCHLGAAI